MTNQELQTSPSPSPERVWPPTEAGLAGMPGHPVLRAAYQALRPLTPILRELTFDTQAQMPSALLGLGLEPYPVGVLLYDEDTVLIDVPVGLVPQTAVNMLKLLSRNANTDWAYRVDHVNDEETEPRVLVVLEYRLPLTDLEQLPGKVLEGWREKRMADGLLYFLRGEGDWL